MPIRRIRQDASATIDEFAANRASVSKAGDAMAADESAVNMSEAGSQSGVETA
jgi:hypothetical protein